MTAYDSIERGAADECKPLTGRRPRTFTLTHLLVACGAVCVCAIAATTVVSTHLANFDDDSALANFDLGSALDDDSAVDDDSAFDDELALADSDDGSDDGSDDSDDEGAQLGQTRRRGPWSRRTRTSTRRRRPTTNRRPTTCEREAHKQYFLDRKKAYDNYKTNKEKCPKPYVKIAGKALKGNGASGACSDRLSYGSSGIKACEEKCNQCDDCKGFVDNRDSSPPYCVFKSATNVYDKASKDWYAKPN
jgi:hypothetical protein